MPTMCQGQGKGDRDVSHCCLNQMSFACHLGCCSCFVIILSSTWRHGEAYDQFMRSYFLQLQKCLAQLLPVIQETHRGLRRQRQKLHATKAGHRACRVSMQHHPGSTPSDSTRPPPAPTFGHRQRRRSRIHRDGRRPVHGDCECGRAPRKRRHAHPVQTRLHAFDRRRLCRPHQPIRSSVCHLQVPQHLPRFG